MEKADFDVIIVGGGMVGCVLACMLASNAETEHLGIAIVEATETELEVYPNQFDARVVAVSNTSQQILSSLDVWPDVVKQRQCAYKEMFVWDGEGTANIQFSCHDIREAQLGFIVENNVILRALFEKIESLKQITIIRPARVKDIELSSIDGAQTQNVILEYKSAIHGIQAGLVVAADGARSAVRKIINIPTKEWDYGHDAIVTTIETELEHKQTAWQRFTASGPIAMLPLSDDLDASKKQNFCSLVWSAEAELASKLMEMNDATFCESLARAFEYKLGRIKHADKRYAISLRQRHAETYIRPGVALVGDAAHTVHPLAGQGVNLGIYDVRALSHEIARSQVRNFSISDFSILQRYERARQSHNLLAMATMEGFKRLFAAEQPAATLLRNVGMRFFNQQNWLKKKLMLLASG